MNDIGSYPSQLGVPELVVHITYKDNSHKSEHKKRLVRFSVELIKLSALPSN